MAATDLPLTFKLKLPAHLIRVAVLAVLTSMPPILAPAIANAQGAPPLRAVLLPRLIPDAIRQMLPIVFDSPAAGAADLVPQKVSVVSMVYCGGASNAAANAYAVGLVVPGAAPALSSPALHTIDCAAPLANVAARLMNPNNGPAWLEVIRLRASWVPWRMTLVVADAAGTAKPGYTAPNLKGLGQIAAYNTSGIRILAGRGSNVAFDLAIAFPGSAIIAVAFPSRQVSNPAPYLNDPAVANEIAIAPAMSNVILDAQYTFVNQVLQLYGSTFDIPLPIEGVTETITAKNVKIAGADNTMTVTGDLEYRSIDYAASMNCEGDDLAVHQVTLDPPSANCNQQDLMERLQCQGQGVAMYGSSKALASAITQYYQGQPLHVSTQAHPLDFAVGDTDYQATFQALKSSSHGGAFSEAGRATVRRAVNTP